MDKILYKLDTFEGPLDLRSLNLETSQGLLIEIDENGENIVAENEENTEQ